MKNRITLLHRPVLCILLALTLLIGSLPYSMSPIRAALAAGNKPHEQGVGEPNVVLDGHDLLVEVRLPTEDAVGFGNEPLYFKQEDVVKQALNGFAKAGMWFNPSPDARCEIESAQASVAGVALRTTETTINGLRITLMIAITKVGVSTNMVKMRVTRNESRLIRILRGLFSFIAPTWRC